MTNPLNLELPLTFILFSFIGSGQITDQQITTFVETASTKDLIEKNTTLIMDGNFSLSIIVANKLLEIDADNANYNYRKGLALTNLNSNFDLAQVYLEKATQSAAKIYDLFSTKETNAPFSSFFYLGRCLHLNNKIEEALKNYERYTSLASKREPLFNQAMLHIRQCKVALHEMNSPQNVEIINLGELINTENPEYAPIVSLDGQSLYFTSRRLRADNSNAEMKEPFLNMHMEDIYRSIRNDGAEWQEPQLVEFCLPNRNEASVAISSDVRNVYVFKDDEGNGDIFVSEFQDGRFKELKKLETPGVNTEFWEPHLTVSADGNSKFFSSDRKGGYGGRDLYYIVKLAGGEWSLPKNMGPKINTPYDEDSPFVSFDNKTLYFSSNGSESMGGFDVFTSTKDSSGDWGVPINMGYPLNSTGDDIYFTTTADGKTGFISSFRKSGSGNLDIYEIRNDVLGQQNITLLEGELLYSNGTRLEDEIHTTISCMNCDYKNVRTVIPRALDGKYFSTLPKCKEFEIVYFSGPLDNKVEFHKEFISTSCEDGFERLRLISLLDTEKMEIIPQPNREFHIMIADSESKSAIPDANVTLMDESGKILELNLTNASGEVFSKVLSGGNFGDKFKFLMKIEKKGYIAQSLESTPTLTDRFNKEFIYLTTGDTPQNLNVDPIYFDLDKSDIRVDAKIILNEIIKIMNENPTQKLELRSHTDCRGSESYNLALSEKRAKSSAQYIQQRISNPERVYSKGYGESILMTKCECGGNTTSACSTEDHQRNRRTEFIMLK